MASTGNKQRPPQVVLEALEGYVTILSEVYGEACMGEHWAGVPDWDDYLAAYEAAENENRALETNADLPRISER